MKIYYETKENELQHASTTGRKRNGFKYIARVKSGKGWRYFYSKKDFDAYKYNMHGTDPNAWKSRKPGKDGLIEVTFGELEAITGQKLGNGNKKETTRVSKEYLEEASYNNQQNQIIKKGQRVASGEFLKVGVGATTDTKSTPTSSKNTSSLSQRKPGKDGLIEVTVSEIESLTGEEFRGPTGNGKIRVSKEYLEELESNSKANEFSGSDKKPSGKTDSRSNNSTKPPQSTSSSSSSTKDTPKVDTSRPYHFTVDPKTGKTIVVYEDEKPKKEKKGKKFFFF